MTTIVGLLAGGIAVGGFLGHVRPSLRGDAESELRRGTTIGGLYGLALAVGIAIVSFLPVGNILSEKGKFPMTEAKALILLIAGLVVVSGALTEACIQIGAGGYVVGLILGLSCAAGGYLSSVVVTHYGKLKERHKREEIILSR